ncbi:hypothetical protein K469DRAFT_630888 [Zopfia rhizophila CBS 207.26]|uniref:Uncharacterized protein n=1 Tax=Zopfia rhizophila CBS 207.26 TaxID=1314779 RepID=A0A6A6E7N2_9PEZI|nr:hypothetical protein K469DRAFT_630888 [Zopfia rhizophila CBS 207.26]
MHAIVTQHTHPLQGKFHHFLSRLHGLPFSNPPRVNMSLSYILHHINNCFDQVIVWFRGLLNRTERSFQAMHQRITFLEDRQNDLAPSDEQMERILRRQLAERFAGARSAITRRDEVRSDGSPEDAVEY